MELDNSEYTFSYLDVTPSELFHKTLEKHITFSLIYFKNIDKEKLRQIPQFKKSKGISRKIKWMKYIIENIKNRNIGLVGLVYSTLKDDAYENGKDLLVNNGFISKNDSPDKIISFCGKSISIGHLISLSWYSILLAYFSKMLGTFTQAEKKNKGVVFLDLLPGDSIDNERKNLEIINFLVFNTDLREFLKDVLKINKIEKIGFGYGMKETGTKELKNDFEYVITDWITQSAYCWTSKGQIETQNEYERNYELSILASFLNKQRFIKKIRPFRLLF